MDNHSVSPDDLFVAAGSLIWKVLSSEGGELGEPSDMAVAGCRSTSLLEDHAS